jgi:hypothetical protein
LYLAFFPHQAQFHSDTTRSNPIANVVHAVRGHFASMTRNTISCKVKK